MSLVLADIRDGVWHRWENPDSLLGTSRVCYWITTPR